MIGQFLDTDFALLTLTAEILKQDEKTIIKAQPKLEDADIERMQDLESRLKESEFDRSDLVKNQETLEKIISDKDRQTRQDKKQIEFLENSIRHIRGELRQTQEMLDTEKTMVRNLEKDAENKNVTIKSINVRFDREFKARAEFEDRSNKLDLQLKKSWQYLTDANKAIKLKDTTIK